MDKLSSTKVAEVLHDAEVALRAVANERDAALAKCAAMERNIECSKLASFMHDKGLEQDKSHDQLVAHLEKAAEAGELPIIHRAVDMIGPNMGLASLSEDNTKTAGSSTSDFESYIFGGIG